MYRLIMALLMLMFVASPGYSQSFRNNNNMLLGKVESDGTVRNANNMRLGKIFEDGTIRDSNNMRLGTISSDGMVRNNNNMKVGTASGINTKYAAVLFFFELF
jgi:hypothetical protein